MYIRDSMKHSTWSKISANLTFMSHCALISVSIYIKPDQKYPGQNFCFHLP